MYRYVHRKNVLGLQQSNDKWDQTPAALPAAPYLRMQESALVSGLAYSIWLHVKHSQSQHQLGYKSHIAQTILSNVVLITSAC